MVIRVELVAANKDYCLASDGARQYLFKTSEILDIESDPAEPSPDELKGAPVLLTVKAKALIEQRSYVLAESLADAVGIRPFVFAIPSQTTTGFTPLVEASDGGAKPLSTPPWPTRCPRQSPRLTPYPTTFPTGDRPDSTTDSTTDAHVDTVNDDGDV